MIVKFLDLNYNIAALEKLNWKVSDYGVYGQSQRIIDLTFRNSFQCLVEIPETNNEERYGAPILWKALKYENGFFVAHVDHQVHPRHRGVEILLPPASQCDYEEGQLMTYSEDQHSTATKPHPSKWTHVFIPLGTKHEVKPVKGTRVSFVRSVYGDKQFAYFRQLQSIAGSDGGDDPPDVFD